MVEPNRLGLPRPLVGALIGILVFLLIFAALKLLQGNSIILFFLALDLEMFGRLIVSALGTFAKIELPENVSNILSILISVIPPGILGWMIGSNRRSMRIAGIISLVIYLLLTLIVGTLLIFMAI